MLFDVFRLITNWIFYNSRQIDQKQVKNFLRVKSDSQRHTANSFVLTTSFLCLKIDEFSKLIHVMIMFPFLINQFSVLLFALDLAELDFDWPSGYDSFAFGKEFFSNDTFEKRTFTWMNILLPVDWEPTTAIIGRLTSRLTSERRIIYWNEVESYLDLGNDGYKFLHKNRRIEGF